MDHVLTYFNGSIGIVAQTVTVLAAVSGATLLTSEPVISLSMTIFGVVALVVYRRIRKFRDGVVKGFWDFLDRNIVELILAAVIAPNLVNSIVTLLR